MPLRLRRSADGARPRPRSGRLLVKPAATPYAARTDGQRRGASIARVLDIERPLLFLHIPKTAGTSLLTALKNVFGDNRVLRADVAGASGRLPQVVAEIVATQLDTISCLVGHLPMYVMARYLERFRPFTLLRDPVARVFSLYRFLRRSPPSTLHEMGLRPGFDLEELMASRRHGVFSQVTNGMCRRLTDDIRMSDPNTGLFWQTDPEPQHAERALAMLDGIDFGLVEDMPRTCQLLGARWGLHHDIDEYVENITPQNEAETSAAGRQLVIRRNVLDLALYERAAAMFRARTAAARDRASANTRALFHPTLNVSAGVADIAGRRGFHGTEGSGFAWLRADTPARIDFTAPGYVARIQLRFYCVTRDYPIDRIEAQLNGCRMPQQARWLSPGWCVLELTPPDLLSGINELAINPPMFLSVRQFQPNTLDARYLSVALSSLTFVG